MFTDKINSLANLLEMKADVVHYFRNDTLAVQPRARGGLTPLPLERSNSAEGVCWPFLINPIGKVLSPDIKGCVVPLPLTACRV